LNTLATVAEDYRIIERVSYALCADVRRSV